jgi:uncharacterized damage-inducible protein DinB
MKNNTRSNRRAFLKKGALLTTSLATFGSFTSGANSAAPASDKDLLVIGPRIGYTPQIGTLVSMLNYMRESVLNSVKGLTKEQLDHLQDANSNSIGALLMHLGATEKYYQINTFEDRQEFNDSEKKLWDAALNLGDQGRKTIKGHDLQHYIDIISEVRSTTLQTLKSKDDEWLMKIDPVWSKPEEQINTYWKWFHVCEHESNHRGQIQWLKGRLPGAKPGKD